MMMTMKKYLILKNINLDFHDELNPWNNEIIQICKIYFKDKKNQSFDKSINAIIK